MRWVIINLIIYACHVIQLVLHVQMKVIVRAVPVMEIIHITLKIFISVQKFVVLVITMINMIVRYVIRHVKLAKINQINLVRVVI